ncbi:MAG: SOS response-associated peptidase [Methylocella sp.]
MSPEPSFRAAFRRRRCLFIADAFYEWRREPKSQTAAKAAVQPYLFRRRDGEPLALAGLWETWTGPNGEELDTACIITTAANGATACIHDRLPAIIEPASFDVWFDPDETTTDLAFGLLQPPENEALEFFEISSAINKAGNDSPEVQKPIGPLDSIGSAVPMKDEEPDLSKPAQGSLF